MVILKQKREQKGISQSQLADRSGIKQQTISLIENGKRQNPGIQTLRPIADALGCTIDDLYIPFDKQEASI